MRVELLYFAGCPTYVRLLPRLRELVAQLAPEATLALRRIESIEQAERERFLGSPTVRVDEVDVDPGAGEREEFGLECRLYRSAGVTAPMPPTEWIRAALTGAAV
ncbi:MAG: DF family (seleno)protein [Solirubrobacterales bacterium]